MKSAILLFVLLSVLTVFSSEHGIYLRLLNGITEDLPVIEQKINQKMTKAGFVLLRSHEVASPDKATEDKNEHCARKGKLLLYQKPAYTRFLTRYGNKYLVAAFIKVGILQNKQSWEVSIADPETINRIVFNDMEDGPYNEAVARTGQFRRMLIATIQSSGLGQKEITPMPPLREAEDIRDASRDMFMMVGPLTFFEDEDQFPQIYSAGIKDAKKGVLALREKIIQNIQAFTPDEDDASYNWASDPKDLKWQIF